MALFAAGSALLALLFASYSRRSTWLALASTALSMAAIVGCLFVVTSQDQRHLRTRLAWVGDKLRPMVDRQTVDDLRTAAAYVWMPSSCGGAAACRTALAEAPAAGPAAAAPATEPPALQAASTTSWFGASQDPEPANQVPQPETQRPEPAKQESKGASQYPVAWRLDEPHVQVSSSSSEEFLISGTNVADQALEDVHAVLKPDASKRELELVLNVDGLTADGGAVIPAGARFSLVAETPNHGATLGGAILAFRYVQAGQSKSSILYLTPSMVGRLANRG